MTGGRWLQERSSFGRILEKEIPLVFHRQFDSDRGEDATRPTHTRVCSASHRHCSVEDIMSGVADEGARVGEMRLGRANRPLRC